MTSEKRILLVGDSCTGKSALAFKLTENTFLDCHEPTGFDDFQTELWSASGINHLTVLDTSGKHEDRDIRGRMYQTCDAVIICFDLTNASTLENAMDFWVPEAKHYRQGIPIYIAGCKKDIACESVCSCGTGNCCALSEGDLLQVMDRTNAVAYAECSARAAEGGVEAWFSAVIESLDIHKKAKNPKHILSVIKKQSKNFKKRFL